jgi:hypothetical protein
MIGLPFYKKDKVDRSVPVDAMTTNNATNNAFVYIISIIRWKDNPEDLDPMDITRYGQQASFINISRYIYL